MASETGRGSAFANNGSKVAHKRLAAIQNNPETAVFLDKLVASSGGPLSGVLRQSRGVTLPNDSHLRKISDITATNINDADSINQTIPETELAKQILVSVILSPNDMMVTDLIYSSGMLVKDAGLSQALLAEIQSFFETDYKIKPLLSEMLGDALFDVGAYPLVILPENVIDAAINSPNNVSIESLRPEFDSTGKQPIAMGVLGNPSEGGSAERGFSLEAFANPLANKTTYNPTVSISTEAFAKEASKYLPSLEGISDTAVKDTFGKEVDRLKNFFSLENSFLTVTDNPQVLKMPMLEEAMRAKAKSQIYGKRKVSLEAKKDGKDSKEQVSIPEMEQMLYRSRRYNNVPVLPLMPILDPDRPSLGHPMVYKVPSECMIPVHVPSNPREHLGYFLLLDINGNFLTRAQQSDYYTDLSTNLNSNQEMVSQLLATTKRAEYGRETNREIDQDEITRVYSELVEKDLMSRLRAGIYGENVEIARPMEVYRVMLSRALAKMRTQILYIPADFVTYIAFDYNKYGVGESLLQKTKVIAGMRSILLLANTMGAIKNSIQRVVLNITLDPDDPQPANTVEFLTHEYAKTRQASYPLGASNPLDIISFLQNAGVEVAVQGNVDYPETKFELEDKASNHVKVDADFDESLRKRHMNGLGVPPEYIDAASGAEFATSIAQNNILMAKRGMEYGIRFCKFLVDFMQKYIVNSSILQDRLLEVINQNAGSIPKEYKSNKGKDDKEIDDGSTPAERYLSKFLQTLELSLPRAENTRNKNDLQALKDFTDWLDEALKAYLDPDAMSQDLFGDYSSIMPAVIAQVRGHFIREFLREQGMSVNLDDLVTLTEDNKPRVDLLDIQEGHNENLMKAVGEMIKKMQKWRDKHPLPTDTPTDDGSIPTDDGTGGTTDDLGGLDDGTGLDGLDDTSGADNPDGSTDDNPTGDQVENDETKSDNQADTEVKNDNEEEEEEGSEEEEEADKNAPDLESFKDTLLVQLDQLRFDDRAIRGFSVEQLTDAKLTDVIPVHALPNGKYRVLDNHVVIAKAYLDTAPEDGLRVRIQDQ